jgi:hypothetical protein
VFCFVAVIGINISKCDELHEAKAKLSRYLFSQIKDKRSFNNANVDSGLQNYLRKLSELFNKALVNLNNPNVGATEKDEIIQKLYQIKIEVVKLLKEHPNLTLQNDDEEDMGHINHRPFKWGKRK